MNDAFNKPDNVAALENGKGIQYLLDTAYQICGNPILMQDLDYKLLAHAKNVVTDDPLWNEIVTAGRFSEESIEFFKDECFVDVVANTKTITCLTSDKLKYDRFLGKLYNKDDISVATVILVACNKPIDTALFEKLCGKLSEEVGKDDFYLRYGESHQEALIGKLIGGDIKDKELYSAHVANMYYGLKNNLYLAVADTTRFNNAQTELTYFRDLFKRIQPSFKYSIYSNYIVIIISTDDMTLNVRKDLHKLKKNFEQYNIYAGISSRFENLFQLRKYYEEAFYALNYGLENNIGRRIILYEQMAQDFPERKHSHDFSRGFTQRHSPRYYNNSKT